MFTNFDNRIGAIGVEVTALADNGIATIDVSDYKDFVIGTATSESDTGVLAAIGTATFSCSINRTTGIATFTNLSGAAFTGKYFLFGIY